MEEEQGLALVERAVATLHHDDLCWNHQAGVLVSAFQEVGDHFQMRLSSFKMRELVSVMERGLGLLSSCKDDFLFQALLRLENREEFKELYSQIKSLIYLKPGREMDYAADLDKQQLIEKCQNLTNVNTAVEIVRAILYGSEPPKIDYNELEVERFIGQGNSGAVFQATWLDRSVAVKFLGRGDDWLSMEWPSDDLINMKHPNLVSLLGYSFETEREQLVLVTEKMTSRNLAQLSKHRTRGRALFSLEDTIEILLQLASGMEYLHSRNGLHKGLKPSNIFVDKNDSGYVVKIGDFGLGTTYWASDITRTGSDLSFMAPEVRESNKYTKHADIYSYGVICDQLLTANLPHEASARSFGQQLPNDLVDLMEKCLSETVKERPPFSDIRNRLELIKSKMQLESVEKLIAAEVAYLKGRGVNEDLLKRSGTWDSFLSIHACVSFALHEFSSKRTAATSTPALAPAPFTSGDHAEKNQEKKKEKAAKEKTGFKKASSGLEPSSSTGAVERENYKLELSALRRKMEIAILIDNVQRFQATILYNICVDVSAWTIENSEKCLPGNSLFGQMMTCFKRALKLVEDSCVAEWTVQAFLRHHGEQEFRILLEDMKIVVDAMAERGYEGSEMVQFRWEDLKIAAERDKKELVVYAKERLQDPLREQLVQRLANSYALHPLLRINPDAVTWKTHDVLGHGARATVYAGEWLNQPVAIKVLHPEYCWTEFLSPGGYRWQTPPHPNVLRTFGFAKTQESQLIVMECMRMDLRTFLDQVSNLSLLTAVDIMLQIARGIRHLHQHGVTHGDVKPQNILVSFDDDDTSCLNVRVAEFCLGMFTWKQDTGSTLLRESRCYMAPELVPGTMSSEKSDVYSFAVTCSEILTQRRPFEDEFIRPGVLRTMIIAGKRPHLPETCPENLKDLINRCWSSTDSERPDFKDMEKHLVTVKKQLLMPEITGSSPLPTKFVRDLIGPVELGAALIALLKARKFIRYDPSPQTFTLSWKGETHLDKLYIMELNWTGETRMDELYMLELNYTITAADTPTKSWSWNFFF